MSSIQASFRTTSGSGGDLSNDGKTRCLTIVAALNQTTDTCVCLDDYIGDGTLHCYESDRYNVQVKNDPQVKTVTGDRFELPVACKYLLTHFRTDFTEFANSTCEVKVMAFNKKLFGKVYVDGVDVALRVSTPWSSPPRGDISYRIQGEGFSGTYWFKKFATYQFTTAGPWAEDGFAYLSMGATNIWPRYDPYNNIWYLKVPSCGFDIRFRPFDRIKGIHSTQVPGVSVSVKAAPSTKWLSPGETMGLQPTGELLEDIVSGFQSVSQAMVARLFLSNVTQNQPAGSPYCSSVAETVRNCSTRSATAAAINTCFFILTDHKFVRCYDTTGSGDLVLDLFEKCFDAECHEDPMRCSLVKQEVQKCPQATNSPEVSAYLNKQC